MKKPRSAIGMSMLDLISNALAATLILFFVLSVLRLPPIPPTRILGILYIRVATYAENQPERGRVELMLQSPAYQGQKIEPQYGIDIERFNKDPRVFGLYGLRYDKIYDSVKAASMPDPAMIYSPVDSPFVKIAIIRDPVEGVWTARLIYVDHELSTKSMQPTRAVIEVWFVKDKVKTKIVQKDSTLFVVPSVNFPIKFETPKWRDEL
ncbi:MAG: hypothetical protein ILNGONEN_00204 [Syntrophorhabdaceae bacterium]|nr:hypothetical protein [Syntrophorhabdaceae bacterium]